jgi:hypothetical protein
MTTSNLQDASDRSGPVLGAALLAQIHELNRDYLDLLTAEYAVSGRAAQLQHLPISVAAGVAALAPGARALLAQTPYSLYSLGFEDEEFWCLACKVPAQAVEVRYAPTASGWLQGPFCEVALVHAWHVASSNPIAARLLYAMTDATAHRLAATPLSHLRRVASDHPGLLLPRWPTNPCFWPDLVRLSQLGDARRLTTVKLLGNQLISAELENAAPEQLGAGGRRHRAPASPRLRTQKARVELRR